MTDIDTDIDKSSLSPTFTAVAAIDAVSFAPVAVVAAAVASVA